MDVRSVFINSPSYFASPLQTLYYYYCYYYCYYYYYYYYYHYYYYYYYYYSKVHVVGFL